MEFLRIRRLLKVSAAASLLLTAAFALPQAPSQPTQPQQSQTNPNDSTPPPISADTKAEVMARVTDLIENDAYVPGLDLDKWQQIIKDQQPKIDEATNDREFARAVNEALSKFGESHFYLSTPQIANLRMHPTLVGIGISQWPTKDGLEVVRLVPGAPAEKAGLVPGDLIIKVNGQANDWLKDSIKGIPGPEGTTVKLTIKHQNGKIQDYDVKREKFSVVQPEELIEVDKDTAKLTIHTFDWTYSRENVENLMRKAQAYKNLILDLRDNGGGAVPNLQHLLGFLIPRTEPVGTFVNKPMVNAYVAEAHGQPSDVVKIAEWSRPQADFDHQQIKPVHVSDVPVYQGHVVVLINGNSGSASEIAGAALHDLIGATLVGQKSAGAVLVSIIAKASNGFTLQVPIMDYVTIRGVRLEGTGLTPEVEVASKGPVLPGQPDEAVEKAQALFARDKLREDRGIGLR